MTLAHQIKGHFLVIILPLSFVPVPFCEHGWLEGHQWVSSYFSLLKYMPDC